MMQEYWWIDSDNLVKLTNLHDALTGNAINDATVSAVFKDAAGSTLAEFDLTYVTDSNGDYAGEIPNDVGMAEGSSYTLTVTAVNGDDFKLVQRKTLEAAYYPGTN